MAEKRMFAKSIIDSDIFIDMPTSARLLYYDLSMRADDDGFVNSPKKIIRMTGASDDDLKILILKNFIIPFETGVVVIKHWRIHNYIRKDTYKETVYRKEKSMLAISKNKTYFLTNKESQRSVDEPSTQIRIDQNRLDKNRIVDAEEETTTHQAPASTTTDNSERQDEQATLSQTDINIFQYLENNFGRTISHSEIEQIHSYQETFTEDIIKEAIDRACANNIKTIGYVKGILNSWKSKGYKTIEQCKKELLQQNKSKNNKKNYMEPEPEWFNKEIKREEVNLTDEERAELEDIKRKLGAT